MDKATRERLSYAARKSAEERICPKCQRRGALTKKGVCKWFDCERPTNAVLLKKLDEVESFLNGSAPYKGVWFGDGPPEGTPLVAGKYVARYWWRSELLEPTCKMIRCALDA